MAIMMTHEKILLAALGAAAAMHVCDPFAAEHILAAGEFLAGRRETPCPCYERKG
jgi:hypothetical protein